MKNRIHFFLIPLLFFILTSVLLALGIYYGWFGEERGIALRFCERAHEGFIRQPSNSYSNLAFSLAGLCIGWAAFKQKFANPNVISRHGIYPLILSIGLVVLGAGSFAMHATNTLMGGFFDLLGMFMAGSFFFAYGLKRWLNFSHTLFVVLFTVGVVISSFIFFSPWNHFGFFVSASELIVAFQTWFSIFLEVYRHKKEKTEVNMRWGYLAIASILVVFLIWNLSLTEESLWCNPDSLIQGHAFWHLLDAFAIYAVFRFYSSEKEKTTVQA